MSNSNCSHYQHVASGYLCYDEIPPDFDAAGTPVELRTVPACMPLQLPHLLLLPERAPQVKAAEADPAQQPGIGSLRASGRNGKSRSSMKEQKTSSNKAQWFREALGVCAALPSTNIQRHKQNQKPFVVLLQVGLCAAAMHNHWSNQHAPWCAQMLHRHPSTMQPCSYHSTVAEQ